MMDDTPNYAEYSLEDLHDVRRRINREKYPERYRLVVEEIVRREQQRARDPHRAEAPSQESQEQDLTSAMLLCGLLGMPVLSVLAHLFNWLFLPQLLRDGQYIMLFPGGTYPFGWLLGAMLWCPAPKN